MTSAACFLFGWALLSFGIVFPLGRFASDGDDDDLTACAPRSSPMGAKLAARRHRAGGQSFRRLAIHRGGR